MERPPPSPSWPALGSPRPRPRPRPRRLTLLAVVCAFTLLLRAPSPAAADDADDDTGDSSVGILGALSAVVRATTSRLSALVRGSAPADDGTPDYDYGEEDAAGDDKSWWWWSSGSGATTPEPSAGADEDYVDDVSGADADSGDDGARDYSGYQVVHVRLSSSKHGAMLQALADRHVGAQVLSRSQRRRTASLLVPPGAVAAVYDALDDMGLDYHVVTADLQKIIATQNPRQASAQQRVDLMRTAGHPLTWERFHRYNDIVKYLQWLALTYPQLASLVSIGASSEGRPLYVLKVSLREGRSDLLPQPRHNRTARGTRRGTGGAAARRPAIWLDAGTHAREWVGPAAALYVCMQLVERFYSHPHLVLDADWYIMPVLNPDGYEFSHTRDRLWRKSRSSHELHPYALRPGPGRRPAGPRPAGRAARLAALFHKPPRRGPCAGVDLNRNWDDNWGDLRGASDDPCSDRYAGPRAFSEPETRAVSRFILRHRERFELFVSLHAFGQLLLLPEDGRFRHLPDHEELFNKAKLASNAMRRVRNTRYNIGTTSEMLYRISGGANNWVKNVAGIKYSYTLELPDRGQFGFLLPATHIRPTGKEAFAGLRELAQAIVCRRD
ncbi:Carboxypeptidase B [Frankliniella fusca]|uniref:Carboxypeptidase B n=1 Tax=Frankliniella fusca TaxID=407009 RepID=A0AAE1HA62_9NEOP|nr:Carboxypeptidase B [Frankliniella fusca]